MRDDGSAVSFDAQGETFDARRERLWIEARLTAERAALSRAHRAQPLADTLAAVRAAWQRERRAPAAAAADAAARAGEAAAARVRASNEAALAAARAEHDAHVARTLCLPLGQL